ncbi:hypothetical protein V8C37DRAFT_55448 [Trichoderma ceciliae]
MRCCLKVLGERRPRRRACACVCTRRFKALGPFCPCAVACLAAADCSRLYRSSTTYQQSVARALSTSPADRASNWSLRHFGTSCRRWPLCGVDSTKPGHFMTGRLSRRWAGLSFWGTGNHDASFSLVRIEGGALILLSLVHSLGVHTKMRTRL